MKKQILQLRQEGKNYNEIAAITGASKGTISYHCGKSVKEKTNLRHRAAKSKIKNELRQIAGGICAICGYSKCQAALEFHHLDPRVKEGKVADLIGNRSYSRARIEAKKCVLLCANCHREVHAGLAICI